MAHTIVELKLLETTFAQTGDKPNILQTRSQYIKCLQTTTGSLNDPRQLNPIRKGHEDLAHPVHVGTILRKKGSVDARRVRIKSEAAAMPIKYGTKFRETNQNSQRNYIK